MLLCKDCYSLWELIMFRTIAYHLIGKVEKNEDFMRKRMYVEEEMLKTHIAELKKQGYHFISLQEAELQVEGKKSSSDKDILITFDDGYLNTINVALPILTECNVSAAMAVCGSYLYPETRKNISMHVEKCFANADQIRAWINAGNHILAHTYSHNKLTKLSVEDCLYEVEKDYSVLKNEFGTAPNGIAYPFGAINEQVIQIVSKYYRYGFVTDIGESSSNRYKLKRVCAERNCTSEELLKLLESW